MGWYTKRKRLDPKEATKEFSLVVKLCLVNVAVANFILLLTLFIPRWRAEKVGTEEVFRYLSPEGNDVARWLGWDAREIGLIHIFATTRQTWTNLVHTTCDIGRISALWTIGGVAVDMISSLGTIGWALLTGRETRLWYEDMGSAVTDCAAGGDDVCSTGLMAHMAARCEAYEAMRTASFMCLFVTFLCFIANTVSVCCGALATLIKYGGLVSGMLIVSGISLIGANVFWWFATDAGFKKIQLTGWYPYPYTAICWYMHLCCGIVVLGSGLIMLWMVLPYVQAYDPEENKLVKRKKMFEMAKSARNRVFGGGAGPVMQPKPAQQPTIAQPVVMMQQPMPTNPNAGLMMNSQPQLVPQLVGNPQPGMMMAPMPPEPQYMGGMAVPVAHTMPPLPEDRVPKRDDPLITQSLQDFSPVATNPQDGGVPVYSYESNTMPPSSETTMTTFALPVTSVETFAPLSQGADVPPTPSTGPPVYSLGLMDSVGAGSHLGASAVGNSTPRSGSPR